ncbi:MAG TPA: acyltransferase [Methylocystis sp.]
MPFLLSQLIEASRWIGALLVLSIHVTNITVNQADIMSAPHAPPVYVWWFFNGFGLGHQAVVGFFVLSGWLVGGAVLAKIGKSRDFLRDYFVHRVSRIYIVLAPALFFTAGLDGAGAILFPDSGVYDWPMFKGHYTIPIFLANLANLQSIYVDYFGVNGPLWSLACEFWCYVLFPLLMMPMARHLPPVRRYGAFLLGLALTLVLAWPESWFTFGFVIWAISAFASRADRPLIRSRWLSLAIYAAVVVLIRLTVRGPLLDAHPLLGRAADVVGAMLFINLLLAFRDGPQTGFSALRWRIHAPLANFSFSLYAIHMPVIVFARAWIGQYLGRDWATELATPAHYAAAIVVVLMTVICGYGLSRLTEARTSEARRALRRLLDRLIPPPAAVAVVPERESVES